MAFLALVRITGCEYLLREFLEGAFQVCDLADVYIAEGGHSSAIIAERKNVECPVPQKVSGAKSRDLTKI